MPIVIIRLTMAEKCILCGNVTFNYLSSFIDFRQVTVQSIKICKMIKIRLFPYFMFVLFQYSFTVTFVENCSKIWSPWRLTSEKIVEKRRITYVRCVVIELIDLMIWKGISKTNIHHAAKWHNFKWIQTE